MSEHGNHCELAFGEQMFATHVISTRATLEHELQECVSPLITIYFQTTVLESSQGVALARSCRNPRPLDVCRGGSLPAFCDHFRRPGD